MVADELLKQQHGLESVEGDAEDVRIRDSKRQLVRRNYIQSSKVPHKDQSQK